MWKWIRVPKGIALVAFLLPWMTVSCSGAKFVSATGIGLALGQFTSEIPNNNAMGGGLRAPNMLGTGGPGTNIWLILAIAAIAIGLLLAFLPATRNNARNLIVTSGAAVVLIFVGTMRYSKSAILAEAASKNPNADHSMDQAAAAMIQVNWEAGYWLALLSLVAAGVMAWMIYSGRDGAVDAQMGSGAAPPEEVPPPVASVTCPTCGTRYGSDVAFCPKDGTALS